MLLNGILIFGPSVIIYTYLYFYFRNNLIKYKTYYDNRQLEEAETHRLMSLGAFFPGFSHFIVVSLIICYILNLFQKYVIINKSKIVDVIFLLPKQEPVKEAGQLSIANNNLDGALSLQDKTKQKINLDY